MTPAVPVRKVHAVLGQQSRGFEGAFTSNMAPQKKRPMSHGRPQPVNQSVQAIAITLLQR